MKLQSEALNWGKPTCDGDNHLFTWGSSDTCKSSPPFGAVCACGRVRALDAGKIEVTEDGYVENLDMA